MNPSKYTTKISYKEFSPHLANFAQPLVSLELTERCNNNCIHCCINQGENDEKIITNELNTNDIKKIIKKIADSGVLTIRFTGGEPLLRLDFNEIYEYTWLLGFRIIIFTNATLIDSRFIDLLKKYPPRLKLEITLYGTSKSEYEKISRVPGSYEKAINGINLLLHADVPFVIKGVIIEGNLDSIEKLDLFAFSLPFITIPPRFSMHFDLRVRRDSEIKNKKIRSLRINEEDTIEVLSRNRDVFFSEMKEFAAKFMGPCGNKVFSCGCGRSGCVDAYGFMHPCLLLKHDDFAYNLNKCTFQGAFQFFSEKLSAVLATDHEFLEKCSKCFLNGLCERCPAKSWIESGTLDAHVDYHCRIAHAKAEFLGVLKHGENAWEVSDYKNRIELFIKS